jgi:hypothetical protein
MRHLAFLCLLSVPAMAGEFAILKNGYRLYSDRHKARGTMVRLYIGQGFTELPAGQVAADHGSQVVPQALPGYPVDHVAAHGARPGDGPENFKQISGNRSCPRMSPQENIRQKPSFSACASKLGRVERPEKSNQKDEAKGVVFDEFKPIKDGRCMHTNLLARLMENCVQMRKLLPQPVGLQGGKISLSRPS